MSAIDQIKNLLDNVSASSRIVIAITTHNRYDILKRLMKK